MTRGRLPLAVTGAAAAVLLAAAGASAHAVLVRSAPPSGASLSAAPAAVVLEFSEPVAPGLSAATVTDGSGTVVSTVASLSADRRSLTVSLRPLGTGVYTVRWRVLSTADGHATTGFFLFAVGQPVGGQVRGTAAAAPPVSQVAVRWLNFAAALFLAGAAAFYAAVLRPSLASLDPASAALACDAVRPLRRAEAAAAGMLVVGVVGEFILQASALLDAPPAAAWRAGLLGAMLGGTKTGWSVLVRLAGAAVLLVPPTPSGRILRAVLLLWCAIVGAITALFGGPASLGGSPHLPLVILVAVVYGLLGATAAVVIPLVPGVRVPPLWPTSLLAAGTILAGVTVNSHAAALGLAASAVDWAHLAAAGVWVGGLPSLWLVLRRAPPSARTALAAVLVPRFSRAAGVSLLVLAVTGMYGALVHVPSVRALAVTPYGRLLSVKLVLVAAAAGLGAYNRFVLRPRLAARKGERVVARFLRALAAEVSVGAAVVLVVAALTITPPASVTLPAATPPQPPLVLAGMAGPFRVELTVTPAQPGWNRLEVTVRGPAGPLDPASSRVLLRALKLDEDLSPVTLTLQPRGDRFAAEGSEVGLAGLWELHVVVRRRGAPDETVVFPLLLGSVTRKSSDPQALRLLERARRAAVRVRTWREREQIADGAGGVAVTDLELVRPDRLRYRTAGGNEAVIIGSTRYFRTAGGPWEKDTLPNPLSLEGPFAAYLQEPQGAVLGRRGTCADEPCQAVVWRSPGGTAVFGAWVGERTARVYRLLMLAPAHHMTAEASDHDLPLRIAPP
ncbi:MAG: copper resistance protein CopC [Armatimonadota bacterium]|nr:copper resistance protein CopC [Armatimonadota bacterium]